MTIARTLALGLLAILAVTGAARADVLMIGTETRGGERHKMTAKIANGRAKIISGNDVVLFRADRDTAYFIDTRAGTVRKMNKGTAREMGDHAAGQMAAAQKQMEQARAAMKEKLAGMDPKNRALVEGMMGGAMQAPPGAPGAGAAPTSWQQTGSGQVGHWQCQKWTGSRGGRTVEDVCASTADQLGISQADYQTLDQLESLMADIAGEAMKSLPFGGGSADVKRGYRGWPVKRVEHGPGGPTTFVAERIESTTFPSGEFDLDPGLRTVDAWSPPSR